MNTKKLLTTKDLLTMFGVSAMTIYHWRSKRDLPTIEMPGSRKVFFSPVEIKAWAKTWEMAIIVPATTLLAARTEIKPGPKAKAKIKTGKVKATVVGTPRGRRSTLANS